ncbi:aspartic peptidase domain-containing protein [Amylocarpus encephaloides]|uniref:Aspartic peptidase domain-containing protein n=1 Tax=Amylocarpus encephaloides TaxID=45428 RepID=A0A9P7YGT8_9HELO|nr:aspartic peptidase domain-containing protein [Amylocarpus encephaloides]
MTLVSRWMCVSMSMSMSMTWSMSLWESVIVGILFFVPCSSSSSSLLTPLSVTPSTNWYGYDGSWSAISLRVGTPQQWVDVMVNTVSSETWIVGPGGCPGSNSLCTTARGAILDPSESSTWIDEGFYNLGIDQRFGGSGYANYGLDHLTFGSTGVSLSSTIIGSINTTEYLLGMFGLGLVPGNFKNVTSLPAISGLVETEGKILSHSYGYTAGAKYQQKGVPNSLTLGGYDANRFQPHDVSFGLNPSQNPQASIAYISLASSGTSNNWTTPVTLATTSDRISAVIDSSTPYLWLPQAVCDRFAQTLKLSYNSSLGLYTFDGNASQRDTLLNSQLSFTIGLSDLGAATNVVNITLPYAAFDLQLSFPFPGLNTTYGAPDSTKYYFPLKVASNEAQYTVGRAFLQEAYLITDYERNTFSVHQAVHTSNPIGNTSIVAISRPTDSTFTPPPAQGKPKSKLSTGAIAGISVAAVVLAALLSLLVFCVRRRKQREEIPEDEKPVIAPKAHSILSVFHRRSKSSSPPPAPAAVSIRGPHVNEAAGNNVYAAEVGADASHERFELPAPLGPAELDSEAGTLSGTTENGSSTTNSNNTSTSERARRKLERQQAAAALESHRDEEYPVEKNDNDIPPAHTHRPLDFPASEGNTPLISPLSGSMTMSSHSSPISPRFTRDTISPTSPPPTYRKISPSNVVYAGRLPSNVQLPRLVPEVPGRRRRAPIEQPLHTEAGTGGATETTTSTLGSHFTENETRDIYHDSNQNLHSLHQPHSPVSSNSPGNSPIGTSNVSLSAATASSNHSMHPPPIPAMPSHRHFGNDGNDRIICEEDESKFLREDIIKMRADMETREMLDPFHGRKRVAGDDIVHVPQPAEQRFSFEEDRVGEGSGTR